MQTINHTLQCSAHCIAQLESVSCLALRLVFGINLVSLLVSLLLMAMVGGYKEGEAEELRLPQDGQDGEDLQVRQLLSGPATEMSSKPLYPLLPLMLSALATDVICSCHWCYLLLPLVLSALATGVICSYH